MPGVIFTKRLTGTSSVNAVTTFGIANDQIVGGIISIKQASRLSVQIAFLDNTMVTSSIEIQTSNHPLADKSSPASDGVIWTPETTISFADAAAAIADQMVHVDNLNAAWCRLVFDVTTGGDASAWLHAKA